jgi:hypothetical protein
VLAELPRNTAGAQHAHVAETMHPEARPQHIGIVLRQVPRSVDAAAGELEPDIRGIRRGQEQPAAHPKNPLELTQRRVDVAREQMLQKLPGSYDIHSLIVERDVRGKATNPPCIDVGQKVQAFLDHVYSPQLGAGVRPGKLHSAPARAAANVEHRVNPGREMTRELLVSLNSENVMLSLGLEQVFFRITVEIKNTWHVELRWDLRTEPSRRGSGNHAIAWAYYRREDVLDEICHEDTRVPVRLSADCHGCRRDGRGRNVEGLMM